MIRFRDTLSRPQPPPWLEGAANLNRRPARDGELWACGDTLYLTDAGPWRDIGDGYAVAGPVADTEAYRRAECWADFDDVPDLRGHMWSVPRVMDAAGERLFRVSYGPDFLPELTPQQSRMLEVAKAARDALTAGQQGTQDVDMRLACQWAAELLCVGYHLSVKSVAGLGILDDALVIGALSLAVGADVEVVK
jgi:hypothetical protein